MSWVRERGEEGREGRGGKGSRVRRRTSGGGRFVSSFVYVPIRRPGFHFFGLKPIKYNLVATFVKGKNPNER